MTSHPFPAPPESDPEAWRDELQHADEPEVPATRVYERVDVKLGKDTDRIVDEAQRALANDPLVYQQALRLVTAVGSGTRSAPTLTPLNRDSLRVRLAKYVRFLGIKRQKADKFAALMPGQADAEPQWEERVAPSDIMGSLLECKRWPDIPEIVGISGAPVLRPDGTIHQSPGYDKATGYLYAPACDYPAIPEHCTRADAERALVKLLDVFVDFPHVAPYHKLVPVAAVLTVLARAAILGPVPAFLFDASTRGSGKTLQSDIVSLLATGKSAARAPYPKEDEELSKTLASYALASTPIVLLDNLTRSLGGGTLDMVLTARDDVQFRMLGRNEAPRLPWTTVLLVSGNNIAMGEDTLRRVLVARLESDLENPEDRDGFAHPDLYGWVRENRAELVAACLTILRAHACHGYLNPTVGRWGSYEAWARVVAGSLAFAGGGDVLQARPPRDASGNDETMAQLVLMRELYRLDPAGKTTQQLIRGVYPAPGDGEPPDGWDDLREAIETLVPTRSGQTPDMRTLQYRLRRMNGRILDGWKLVSEGSHGGRKRWRSVPRQ